MKQVILECNCIGACSFLLSCIIIVLVAKGIVSCSVDVPRRNPFTQFHRYTMVIYMKGLHEQLTLYFGLISSHQPSPRVPISFP